MFRKTYTVLLTAVVCCLSAVTAMAQAKLTDFPIAVGDSSAISISGAYGGVNYLVGIEGSTVSENHITAQLVSPSGSLVGSRISVGRTGGAPYVAFDGTNYLMTWTDDEHGIDSATVYGQFVSVSGSLVGPAFPIVALSGAAHAMGITFGDTTYLLVYHVNDTLFGQRLSKAGNLIGGEVQISSTTARDPGIAFDGINFLAAWCDEGNGRDIYGQFISPSGVLVGTNFLIDGGPYRSDNPVSLAFDGLRYLVAFHDQANNIDSTGWNLLGCFVTTAGVVEEKFTICDSTKNPQFPMIAFDGASYLIAWDNYATAYDTGYCAGRFFNTTGSPLDTTFTIFIPSGDNLPFYGGLIYGGNQFLSFNNSIDAAFTISYVYGAFIPKYTGVAGNPVDPVNVSSFKLGQNAPNPINQSTMINYQLTKPGLVNLTVYNTAGQLVKTLVNAYRQPGSYTVNWNCTGNDSRKVANGVYMARMESEGRAVTNKMVVVR
jgi:hypothetical protein